MGVKQQTNASLEKDSRDAVRQLHSVADLVRWCGSEFNAAQLSFGHGFDNAIDEALALTLHALSLAPSLAPELFAARLTRRERKRVVKLALERITSRRPLAYVLGEAWFAGCKLYVDERVLVPRSPLAEWIQKGFEPFLDPARVSRIADLGTGSGCIAIACANAFPSAQVDAVDLSAEALAVAARNVAEHGLEDRIRLIEGDLLAPCEGVYDLIISNPPYVPSASFDALPPEFHHEPALALHSGKQGLDHVSRILSDAEARLSDDGVLVVEVGEAQAALTAAYPQLPLVWLEFERGGEGVFLIDRLRLIGLT